MNENELKVSPMMLQWHACKQAAGDALLLFRMGDFYEAFYDDAIVAARELELTLTKRQEIPMSGVPHHTSEVYIDRLVGKGYRVAVAEQIGDPKQAKGLVHREVVRVVTPGSLINSSLLSEKRNNFAASLARAGQIIALSTLDLTTSDFRVMEMDNERELLNELFRLQPSEIVASPKFQEKHQSLFDELRKSFKCLISTHEEWRYDHQVCYDFLSTHFGVKSLDGLGLCGRSAAINAAGSLLSYLQDILCHSIAHVRELKIETGSDYMTIDRATWRHLDLAEQRMESTGELSQKHTLLSLLDQSKTAMGARLIRQWLKQPLLNPTLIHERQEAVEAFFFNEALLEEIRALLDPIRDLERLMMKIRSGFASPRDLLALKSSLEQMPTLKTALLPLASHSKLIEQEEQSMHSLPQVVQLIGGALVDDPPIRLKEGRTFREGYCKELDELYEISRDAKSWLLRYQNELKESTGIKTLKISFNKMFGYFIEVSKGQAEKMDERFQRRQTLVNAERFTTPELGEFENRVMHAEERIGSLETELFAALRSEIAKSAETVQRSAQAIAKMDALQGLAKLAKTNDYVRPLVDEGPLLEIQKGRHPVIEAAHIGERFIPNDTLLDDTDNRLLLITGPNMAGKSTYIRQVALIVAHGPDRLASSPPTRTHRHRRPHLHPHRRQRRPRRGQSTFMVEMSETANILNNATSAVPGHPR